MRLTAPTTSNPPRASIQPTERSFHGKILKDDYFWLKDQGYPEVTDESVLSYLKQENSYFENIMGDHKAITDEIFSELKGRIKEDDEGVPFVDGAYEYRWVFEKGAQYRSWYRRKSGTQASWDLYFDEVKEAEGLDFFKLHDLAVSPDGRYLAWSTDTNGSERFTINVKDLMTGETLSDAIENTSGEVVWSSDSLGFCYVIVSQEWRPYLVQYHALGKAEDSVIYEEKETSFFVHISSTSSKQWLEIRSADHVTAENHMVPLATPLADPICLAPRSAGHDYTVDHGWDNQFVIRSNRRQSNFDLYLCSAEETSTPTEWTLFLSGDKTRYIRGHQLFKEFIVVQERLNGLDKITIILRGGEEHAVQFPEDVCECSLGSNYRYETEVIRVAYTSMISPLSVYDYHVTQQSLTLMKEQAIPSGYSKDDYTTSRVLIEARDGEHIPISIVHRKDWKKGADAPVHLYGYGAYGLGMSPSFSSARLSLLDRGFAYAIAHIRGGDEMGYDWYTAGKLKSRTNSFNDFVDCAQSLIDRGLTTKGSISISGGSAGGELMGAVLNQAPDLFKAAVLHVPFVDVLNTMLDDSLPLTPIEWPEWGNPIKSAEDYETIASYCPYSNIGAKDYPPQLVTGGLNDPRVTYWEPAKWTAKMRAMKTDKNLVMMKMNMGAGHAGKSGRFERLKEVAEEYTFLLMSFGRV
ncbi:S9 family peptidase [Temperatibacter marinus]|uniref:S9 family peptidase n=1 Tax=Temperatibacter marinus TaxID=1456591 RepID=A0AA52EG52_9PROT|nr:S9 family peptidase [Temperatibacter marinus]WND03058.1 S9 family peptidase [Temperatibacter marinus]